MPKSQENKAETHAQQSGNAVIIVLVALVLVAGGALAYLSTQMAKESKEAALNTAIDLPAGGRAAQAEPQIEIEPGNPVIAKVGGEDITRLQLLEYIQTLPPQTQQLPLEQLFLFAQEQIINAGVVTLKAKDVNLDSDPEVKRQLELAKEQITRTVYLQNAIEARVTEERVKEAYDKYVATFPDVEEVKASHILVDDKSEAESIIEALQGGADFAALAAEKSKDTSSASNGDLGYFLKSDVVPPFGEAAFSAEVGTLVAEPVKSDFGYHVIKVTDKRKRQPVSLEAATPELSARLRQAAANEVISAWREEVGVERFDVNGKPITSATSTQ